MGARASKNMRENDRTTEGWRDEQRRSNVSVARPDVEDRSTEEIRAEIERTRADMAETWHEIQERLSAENLKEEAKSRIREATIGRVEDMTYYANRKVKGMSRGVMDTVRENPIPAAMVGIGLGWLLMNRQTDRRTYYTGYGGSTGYTGSTGRDWREDEDYRYQSGRMQHGTGRRMRDFSEDVRETGHNVRDRVEDMAHDARERVEDFTHDARERVEHLSHEARMQMEELGEGVQERARWASDRFQDTLYRNPLGVAAAAVALGLIVGLAVPETQKEHELMGEMRDNFVDRAQEVTQEAMHRAQRVVEEAGRAAAEESEEQLAQVGVTDRGGVGRP
jgi:ElaB/YqjD/DUF883 family membrane-anchored ribosome-binding protein